MKVNFKQPRYIIPIIALPFLFLFYYIINEFNTPNEPEGKQSESLQDNIADVSEAIKKRELSDKLEAFRNQYKNGDGYTAITQLQEDQIQEFKFDELYNENEKRKLDSIEKSFLSKQSEFNSKHSISNSENLAIQKALENIPYHTTDTKQQQAKNIDPMELFRKQMQLADSFAKANNPELISKAPQLKPHANTTKTDHTSTLKVEKYTKQSPFFNTVKDLDNETPIKAIIDENRTTFADSRLRIRVLEDLKVGQYKIEKGTFLYANVTGFSAQRVLLSIKSILYKDDILPIEMDVYDQDGQIGLYIPASEFREFTRNLSSDASQGLTLNQQAENNAQLLMSTLQRMFQSTNTAINRHMRRNKAKLKYNTSVYLMDSK